MKIRSFKWTPEIADCRYCLEYHYGRCRAEKRPWINERIEAGVLDYREALKETLFEKKAVNKWLHLVELCNGNDFWKDADHKRRFEIAQAIFGINRKRNTPAYYAALYLLTSEDKLFKRVADCFTKTRIDFRFADLYGITPEGYAIYKTAKCLYAESAEVGADEIADPELFGLSEFRLAINAMLISRYGLSAVYLNHEVRQNGSLSS